jgi:NADP-dependent 3-hydroxy acid dehydrogenase YdfG
MQNIKAKVVAITSASSGSEPIAPLLAAEGASLLGALHRAVVKKGGAWRMVLWHATNVP